jgi:hypothetical protein
MSAPDLLAGFIDSGGIQIGAQVKGIFFIPNSLAAGLAMQDANGSWWLLQIGTDGRLNTTQVIF